MDYFFRNRDLFATYTEYEHKFEIEIKEKIRAHSYSNINLKITDLIGNINILIVINMS